MGRYFEQTESRSELQQRIAADLREKAAQKAKQEGEPVPNVSGELIENSEYLKGTKATTTLAPFSPGPGQRCRHFPTGLPQLSTEFSTTRAAVVAGRDYIDESDRDASAGTKAV